MTLDQGVRRYEWELGHLWQLDLSRCFALSRVKWSEPGVTSGWNNAICWRLFLLLGRFFYQIRVHSLKEKVIILLLELLLCTLTGLLLLSRLDGRKLLLVCERQAMLFFVESQQTLRRYRNSKSGIALLSIVSQRFC